MSFVVYSSYDETLVFSKDKEKKLVKEFFLDDTGRDIDKYTREEIKKGYAQIVARVSTEVSGA